MKWTYECKCCESHIVVTANNEGEILSCECGSCLVKLVNGVPYVVGCIELYDKTED